MDAQTLSQPSISTIAGGIEEQLTVIERRAGKSARLSSTAAVVAAVGLAAAILFMLLTPGPVPTIEQLTLPADVVDALKQVNNPGGLSDLPFDSVVSTLTNSMVPMMKVLGLTTLVLGLLIAVVKGSFTPILMAFPLLGAAYLFPAMMEDMVETKSPQSEITIECVSERRCFSALNQAAPVGTASRHFINAQLYAYGSRPEAVVRELNSFRSADGAAEIDEAHTNVVTALLIAAGETPTGAHAEAVAAATRKHQQGEARRSMAMTIAGAAGAFAAVLGAFAIFLRRRVRSIKEMLRPANDHREKDRPASLPDIEYDREPAPDAWIEVTDSQSEAREAFSARVEPAPRTA